MRIARFVTRFWVLFAVGWAVFVLGAFFVLRFVVPPFSHWSHGDQAQLFQGMVGLAGFGAGLLAVGAAMFQIGRLTAEPVLTMSVARIEGEPYHMQRLVILQILNKGSAVCRDWQVAVTVTPQRLRDRGDEDWVRVADGSLVHNASGKPLFPGSALALPAFGIEIDRSDLPQNKDVLVGGTIHCFISTELGREGPQALSFQMKVD